MKTKNYKITLASAAALFFVGGGESYAQSATKASLFTADNGYTEVKSLPTDPAELAKYYYVIADASEEKILQLADGKSGQNGSGKVMEYVDVNNPLQNQGDLWIIEHTTEGYHIRSVAYSGLLMQTEWNAAQYRRTNDQPHACQWTKVNMTYTEAGWQIENGTYTSNYFGYWGRSGGLNEIASNKTGDDIGKYKIYQIERAKYFENYYKSATKDADGGVDVTNLIVNPDVMGGQQYQKNVEGYSITYNGGHNLPYININGVYQFEFYGYTRLDFTMTQTASVPNGKYKLTTTMFTDQGGTANGNVGMFANDKFVGITENGDAYKEYSIDDIAVTDETLTLGYKTSGTAETKWFRGSGFKLTYYGEDVQAYVAALNSTISEAVKITPNASDAANKALEEAIAVAKEKTSETTSDALIEANNALKAAVEKYNAYVSLKEALGKYPKKSWSNTEFAYYDNAKSKYESAEAETADVKNIVDGMLNEYRQYLRDIVKNYKTATAFVTTATCDKEYNRTDNIPGWTQTTGATNHGTCKNIASEDGSGIYMENWASKLSGDIKQTVSNIPNGKYFLKMSARTNPAEADLVKDYIYIKSGDTQRTGAVLKNDNPSITITDAIEVKNGEVEIGLHIGSGCQWAIWNKVELYAYSIDDQTRSTSTGKYGTVSLPYNATVEGAKLYEAAVNDAKNEVVLTEVNGNVEAGKAYIYQATADAQTFSFVDDANMVKDPAAGALTGVFAQQTAPAGTYVMQTKDGEQKFFKVAEGQEPTLKAYRAYLNVETTSAAKALTISFGNPTAVDAVKALTEDNAVIYDLTGKRLAKLQRGVNIVNGVKVVVK